MRYRLTNNEDEILTAAGQTDGKPPVEIIIIDDAIIAVRVGRTRIAASNLKRGELVIYTEELEGA